MTTLSTITLLYTDVDTAQHEIKRLVFDQCDLIYEGANKTTGNYEAIAKATRLAGNGARAVIADNMEDILVYIP
jgi:hypothetical protein